MNSAGELLNKYCSKERYVKVKDVAKHLNMNIWTVYRKAKNGEIKCHKFGKSYRFILSEVDS